MQAEPRRLVSDVHGRRSRVIEGVRRGKRLSGWDDGQLGERTVGEGGRPNDPVAGCEATGASRAGHDLAAEFDPRCERQRGTYLVLATAQ